MAVQGSSDVLVDELYETTYRLRQFVEARLREKGASVARLRALRMLARARQPLRMRELSEMAGIAARTATSIVDSLERDGLVERIPHPQDRRALLVRLTEEGLRCHREAEEIDRLALAEATAGLDEDDRAHLRALLARIRAHTHD
ncbi:MULTISPECIES: MarR family winged helix-turn-helix transcriptional regulator [unclassified Streptomyces]|jgi:DNA-binding MarR family transcriptional regulator|uniref:MarR family winged helix-turn-helix transcriptional regulator n=1 Tax=unclassified Streptomyces TaxID=2593676 RepID=UPI00036F019A|nr:MULTISPECIES: MarR family transcriptional regulator [unclassified Streptomyces]MYS48227.1 MarR family transcriptional regulator [Streptomyces sp. SID5998]MYX25094.1 MarR family transcriptional regulator [Streptomyces sp. SID8381]MYX43336.1 MarR family transcriptional regulator [Streptomyces sp. SID89]NED74416.1 MarR family transcriptional regulator [Streptomyces sp. SID9944]